MFFGRKVVLLLACLASFSCDPGITIRQVKESDESQDSKLEIRIPTTMPLIGEGIYAPEGVQATNLSKLPIKITTVQLISYDKIYPDKQMGPTRFPMVVPPGKTVTLPVWFDLDSDVSRVFKTTVEFKVLYEQDSEKGEASVFLFGGRLESS